MEGKRNDYRSSIDEMQGRTGSTSWLLEYHRILHLGTCSISIKHASSTSTQASPADGSKRLRLSVRLRQRPCLR